MTTNKQETVQPIDPQLQKQPELHVNDVIASRNIVKVALERGTFKDADELKQVLATFERLDVFAKYAAGVELFLANQRKAAEAAAAQPEPKDDVKKGRRKPEGRLKQIKKAAKQAKAKKK